MRPYGTPLAALALALLLGAATLTPAAAAAARKTPSFGLGIVLGEPTGLTGKLLVHPNHALDVILAWDISDEAFAAAVDYHVLFDPWPFDPSFGEMPLYVGVGGKIAVFGEDRRDRGDDDRDVAVGVRIPIGISFFFDAAPIEAFLEIAPGIRIFPSTSADVDGGIGVRFYFG